MAKVLDHIEIKLSKIRFLTGQKLTIVDVMIYCGLITIFKLYERKISNTSHPRSAKWFKEISELQAIRKMDLELEVLCQLWGLVEKK